MGVKVLDDDFVAAVLRLVQSRPRDARLLLARLFKAGERVRGGAAAVGVLVLAWSVGVALGRRLQPAGVANEWFDAGGIDGDYADELEVKEDLVVGQKRSRK